MTWSRAVEPDDTLDALLTAAGLTSRDRLVATKTLAAQYDPRRLRPGDAVRVRAACKGASGRVSLTVANGTRFEATFGEGTPPAVAIDTKWVTRGAALAIERSSASALDEADLPVRFANDLALVLRGVVELGKDGLGSERLRLRLLWREPISEGTPILCFAVLEFAETTIEIVWSNDGTGPAAIYRDGRALRVVSRPVDGARLSSSFGRRKHPIYGGVRQHTGIDLATPKGTPVRTTRSGRVRFVGRRGGYGRMIEIAHGADLTTRYAHLSAVAETVEEGTRVVAGAVIGRVGDTGTATGPNLHYEVRRGGRAVDPLPALGPGQLRGPVALARLRAARARLERSLTSGGIPETIAEVGGEG